MRSDDCPNQSLPTDFAEEADIEQVRNQKVFYFDRLYRRYLRFMPLFSGTPSACFRYSDEL